MNNEQKADFFDYLMQSGMDAAEAVSLTDYKAAVAEEIKTLEKAITLGKMLPLNQLEAWDSWTAEQRNKKLWTLGFDTKRYKYVIDVQGYANRGIMECGKVIYGQERVDKGWTNKVIDGCNVASEEARYYYMRDELQVMRGNKKQ